MSVDLDGNDKLLLNNLQGGFPLASRPFREVGDRLGLNEDEVISRLRRLLESGALSRFGPVLSAAAMGGARTLAAMQVPPERLEEVAAVVNSFAAVSHNYQREHHFNLWFVVSAADTAAVERVLAGVEQKTGIAVMNLPAVEEYFVEVKFHFGDD
jgi:DNA-binding Lrp family transcriptional regulator